MNPADLLLTARELRYIADDLTHDAAQPTIDPARLLNAYRCAMGAIARLTPVIGLDAVSVGEDEWIISKPSGG